jgi:hypothetical protein
MDWKYKHFKQEAIYNASHEAVLEAARSVITESLREVEATNEGVVARGYSAWHLAIATCRIIEISSGTKVAVELAVERASRRGYMLVDIGGYYNGQIDKWFRGIAERLGEAQQQIIVTKTTSNTLVRQGCLAGCLIWFIVGGCVGLLTAFLGQLRSLQFSASFLQLLSFGLVFVGFLAGVVAFLYVAYPDASISKFLRGRLGRNGNKLN